MVDVTVKGFDVHNTGDEDGTEFIPARETERWYGERPAGVWMREEAGGRARGRRMAVTDLEEI